MSGALARAKFAWHYSEGVEVEILEHVRERRCALVFDLCNEGPAYDADIFEELFSWIEIQQFRPGQVVWLAQNRSMKSRCQAKAGDRANLITFEHYDFFVKMIASLFAPPTASRIMDIGPTVLIEKMFDPARKDKLLLCLNATPRLWRVLSVSALIHHGLLDKSLVSFPGMSLSSGKFPGWGSPAIARAFVDTKPSLQYLRASVDAALLLGDLTVDHVSEHSQLYESIDYSVYERTFLSLVTETEFTEGSVDRVTEKIVKPFCLGHPAIIVGNPNSIRYMTELGFMDWDGVIDRTYETEQDPPRRFAILIDELLRQVAHVRHDSHGWLSRVHEVGSANIRHAFSGRFMERYREVYDRPLVARLAKLVAAPEPF
jgi:hypothetical protein